MRDHTVGEAQHAGHHDVHPVAPEQLLGAHALGLTCQVSRHAHRVAAQIHQAAAIVLREHPRIRRVAIEAEHPPDQPQRADRTVSDQLLEPLGLRVVAVHERFAEVQASRTRKLKQLLDLSGRTAERLLAEDVLAGLQRAARPLHVHAVWQRDVDDLHVLICQQLVVAAICALNVLRSRILGGPARVATRDRIRRRVRDGGDAAEQRVVDPSRRKEPPVGHSWQPTRP